MLVLSRHTNEQIMIGDGITVTICDIGKSSVRIGIEAPDELNIRRAEIPEQKKERTTQ